MPGPCRLCSVATSPFSTPADRLCAFDEQGNFREKNYGCATLERLRGVALFSISAQVGNDFVRLAPIAHADRFVLLIWNDNSHRIPHAFELRPIVPDPAPGLVIDRHSQFGVGLSVERLTLRFAEEVILGKAPRRSQLESIR